MRVSIGIPVHNEEEVVPKLLARLLPVLDALPGGPHQVVFVDDGSTDGTRELLTSAARRDTRLKIVALSRNFGHQAALGAALDHATGDALVLMDGDLQDEPEIIPELVRHYEAGADVVYARRASREEGWVFRAAYKLYYRIMASLSEVSVPLDSGDFALLGPRVVAALQRIPERQRYLRGLRAWVGFKQVGVDVQRRARAAGRPKYTDLEADSAGSRWHLLVFDGSASRSGPDRAGGHSCRERLFRLRDLHAHRRGSGAGRVHGLVDRHDALVRRPVAVSRRDW